MWGVEYVIQYICVSIKYLRMHMGKVKNKKQITVEHGNTVEDGGRSDNAM